MLLEGALGLKPFYGGAAQLIFAPRRFGRGIYGWEVGAGPLVRQEAAFDLKIAATLD